LAISSTSLGTINLNIVDDLAPTVADRFTLHLMSQASFNPFNSERHCNLFGSIISVVFILQMINHVLAVIVLEVFYDPCIQRLDTSGSILGQED
jgi:hypothetical protein